jgi:Tol biopolymer transport system component
VDRSPSGNNWIVGCLVETGDRQSLTQPPNGLSDTGPAISPDGRYLAFVRTSPGYNMGQVFVQPIDGLRPVGAPTQLTQEHSTGTVAWTHDSATVVYERHGSGLWRIAVGGGTPEPLLTNVRAHGPSISRNGGRLAFQNTSTDANIWRLPGPAAWDRPGTTLAPQRIVASTLADMSPQVSPDGRSIAFMSEQSGSPEIWMSASDGSQAEKLTSISGAFLGSPRWSQDQRFVAFDSTQSGSFNIQVVGVADRRPRAVTTDTSGNIRPSWSRDGRSIYFTSTRTGEWQIWKVAAEGGRPTQVTKQGGYEAFESADGHLYYAKRPGTQGIWKVPVDGGPEVQVLERGRQISWALIDAGIVLLDGVGTPHPRIEFFAFESTRSTTRELPADVRLAPIRGPHFSVSRDGEWLAVVQNDNWGSDIYRIDGRW